MEGCETTEKEYEDDSTDTTKVKTFNLTDSVKASNKHLGALSPEVTGERGHFFPNY